ncbi:aminodeoxychorismate lyase [Jeotgalibacillus sp. S-D1]|uniref:aminodeoxychorismate lyase n=1 Tax=Jeotgalibacillus sp. S-D1 TaxID=2552189 RepID=UPI00105A714E|nr:aminodeoxychorismate lyase [Jeotgalibacillus sp. S-D1]TDL30400.1 aminodeoxychorismate lyase [Jeotgalibacillus sp. S-D1]
MKIWINGSILSAEEAKISPFDHGYLYGLGVFETFRTYGGHPFLLGDHLDRLNEALKEMGINYSLGESEAAGIVQKLQQANGGSDGYYRLNVSAGIRDVGLFPEPYDNPVVMLIQKELPPQNTGGKAGQWLSIPRNTPETKIRLKSHHYLNNIAARREVTKAATEGIFLTADGFVAEGVSSNIFWIEKRTLYTPALSTGILPGVTRKMVLALAGESDLHVSIGNFKKEAVLQAEEVFITNSIQEIVPIHSIEDTHFSGTEGKWTRHLLQKYQQSTRSLMRIEDR